MSGESKMWLEMLLSIGKGWILPLSFVSQTDHTWVAQVLSQHRRNGVCLRTLILIVVAHLAHCLFLALQAGWQ